jgi:hypothetical protein
MSTVEAKFVVACMKRKQPTLLDPATGVCKTVSRPGELVEGPNPEALGGSRI